MASSHGRPRAKAQGAFRVRPCEGGTLRSTSKGVGHRTWTDELYRCHLRSSKRKSIEWAVPCEIGGVTGHLVHGVLQTQPAEATVALKHCLATASASLQGNALPTILHARSI